MGITLWVSRYLFRGARDAANRASRHLAAQDRDPYRYEFRTGPRSGTNVGICMSGGGVRSASFGLGALQRTREDGLLKETSYLSAVSGGGYIAAALAITESHSNAADFEQVPAWGRGSPEARYLRANSDYLAPGIGGRAWLLLNTVWGVVLNMTPILACSCIAGGLSAVVLRSSQPGLAGTMNVGSLTVPRGSLQAAAVGIVLATLLVGLWRWRETKVTTRRAASKGSSDRTQMPNVIETLARALLVFSAIATLTILLPAAVVVSRLFMAFGTHVYRAEPFPWKSPSTASVPDSASTALVVIGAFFVILGAMSALAVSLARRSRAFKTSVALAGLAGPLIVALPGLAMANRVFARPPRWNWEIAALMVLSVACVAFAVFAHNGQYSMHLYYRQRLAQVFALRRADDGTCEQIDYADPIWFSKLEPPADFPELIMCTAVNVSDRVVPRGRHSAPFTFTRDKCGSPVFQKDFNTADIESRAGLGSPPLTLPSIVSLSGAALSPVMGRLTIKPLRLLLAIFNVRLGVWIRNLNESQSSKLEQRENKRLEHDAARVVRRRATRAMRTGGRAPLRTPDNRWRYPDAAWWTRTWRYLADGWREPGALYVWREATGSMKLDRPYIYITDGGHWDNLGLVELVRRRCSHIVCYDASLDPNDQFGPLRTAIAMCRSDLGVTIEIDPRPLVRNDGIAATDTVRGRILYADQPAGTIVYTRATICEATSAALVLHAAGNRKFPDHSTGDQFFNDEEFEAFRSLGYDAAGRALDAISIPGFRPSGRASDREGPILDLGDFRVERTASGFRHSNGLPQHEQDLSVAEGLPADS